MRVEDLTKFEEECPTIVVFNTYMDIRVPLTKKWKKIIDKREDKPNTYHNNLINYISEQIEMNGKIETSKGIKVELTEAERLWRLIKVFHNGGQFQHDLALDVTGHRWAFNRYENDMLTAGCHRIAYSEMESIAKQLGWA